MKTDTGEMERGNCEDFRNYVCEKPASAISKYKSCYNITGYVRILYRSEGVSFIKGMGFSIVSFKSVQ